MKINEVKEFLQQNYMDTDMVCMDADKVISMILSCARDDNKKRQREGLKKLKELGKGKKKFTKEKEGRLFGMIYEFDYGESGLNLEEEGLYSKLRQNIQLGGSGLVVIAGVHSRKALGDYCNISKNKISGLLNSLEDKSLIKVIQIGRSIEIYINPYYYRVSRWASDELISMFNLPEALFES